MEDKQLEVKKDNFFSKISNFFKGLFKKKVEQELPSAVENIEEKETKDEVVNEVRNNVIEESKLLQIQSKFENNEIEISAINDDELKALYELYLKQNEELRKILADKLNQLEIIQNRIDRYKSNM